MDITDIPMARGFIYLTAVLDWFMRCVLAWRVSNTLEANFCVEAVEEAYVARSCARSALAQAHSEQILHFAAADGASAVVDQITETSPQGLFQAHRQWAYARIGQP